MMAKRENIDPAEAGLPPEICNEIREAVKKCYSCNKCISGCPLAFEMGLPPSLIIKWLALGRFEKIVQSNTIWLCSSCQSCFCRCPFEVNIPHIIDMLKEHAYKNRLSPKERATRLFHKIFLSQVKRFGRIHETSLIGKWKIFSGNWFSDIGLGMKMFSKGKLTFFPEKIKNQKEVKSLFK